MGKMKELFIQQQDEYRYTNTYNSMIHDLATKTIEEYTVVDETCCPNCGDPSLIRNESNAKCTECAQEFIYVEEHLRFL